MADVSRRGFLTQMSIGTGVGIVGGLGLRQLLTARHPSTAPLVAPQLAPSAPLSATAAPLVSTMDGITLAGPMLVHVRDLANAEVSLMVGTQELVYRDPELVSRLVSAAASASQAEA